jgi:hypothetical protein
VTSDELATLAAGAVERAFALITAWDERVAVDEGDDLARLAASMLGTAALAPLAARAGRRRQDVEELGATWAAGGREALAVARRAGSGDDELPPWAAAEARAALEAAFLDGAIVRVRGNRVSCGPVELRWAPSGRWYRFDRVGGRWRIAGSPATDPAELC